MAQFDAIIVGGGPAGLSAALSLGRARRSVLVCDVGQPRNSPAKAAHNVFTRDGTPPLELLATAREQLRRYEVTLREGKAVDAAAGPEFSVSFADGTAVTGRKLILATGVEDVLPETPGFRECWGQSLFHCPYCHGWEVRDQPLAIYASGETAMELAVLISGWSRDLVLFTDGPAHLSDEQRERLARRHIPVHEERVQRLDHTAGQLEAVVLETGERVARSGLFLRPPQRLRSDLPHRLGCPLTADGRIKADATGKTEIPGLFVAGDAAPGMQSVISAASGGALAGAALNRELLMEDFESGYSASEVKPQR